MTTLMFLALSILNNCQNSRSPFATNISYSYGSMEGLTSFSISPDQSYLSGISFLAIFAADFKFSCSQKYSPVLMVVLCNITKSKHW